MRAFYGLTIHVNGTFSYTEEYAQNPFLTFFFRFIQFTTTNSFSRIDSNEWWHGDRAHWKENSRCTGTWIITGNTASTSKITFKGSGMVLILIPTKLNLLIWFL